MGYQSSYYLYMSHRGDRYLRGRLTKDERENLLAAFHGHKDFECLTDALDKEGGSNGCCKDCGIEQEIHAISCRHPNVLFVLEHNGDDHDDIGWIYFLDGRTYEKYADLSVPPFDPGLLSS